MATIPLSWNDALFSDNTNSGFVNMAKPGTISNTSITHTGGASVAVGVHHTGGGSFTLNDVRMQGNEGVDIFSGGDVYINNSYIETTGAAGDHADGIQIYAPGAHGSLTVTNTTIVSHNQNATAGMFVADYWYGTVTLNNVVFDGGPYGLRIGNDAGAGHDQYVALKDVYFIKDSFLYSPILFQEVNAQIHITQWDNVRWATIVNGELVAGALIAPPQPVEGSPSTPTTPTAPGAPTIASFSTDSGVAGDKVTNDNTLTLTGSAAANSTVKVFDGSTQIGSATANGSGAWTYTTPGLSDGNHSLKATATTGSGTSAASSALAVKIDTTAPTAPTMATPTNNANGSLNLTGTAEANSVVKVFDGTTQIGTATTNGSGVWGYTTGALAAGSHSLTAKATDAAGNTGAVSAVVTASTGTSAPPIPPTSPTPTPSKPIELAGATSLVEIGDKFYLKSSSGSGPSLKYGGKDFVDGTDGTWTPIGAEKTATGYQVAWKEASTGRYTAWNTDNNGNYVSHVSTLTGSASGGSVSGTNSALKSLETSFHQDLNGDGQIGASSAPSAPPTSPTPTPSKPIELAGATSLVESGDKYYLKSSSGSGPSLKYGGKDFVDGQFGGWAPIGAEKTATGYQVAWKDASTGQYTAWNTDNNGNYVSNVSGLTGVAGTNSARLRPCPVRTLPLSRSRRTSNRISTVTGRSVLPVRLRRFRLSL